MYGNRQADNSEMNRVMSNEQFDRIVDAILSGKYSWACLLILRFSGYNPLHYIPYRTYNRLMKANRSVATETVEENKKRSKLKDLYYLEDVECESGKIQGGNKVIYLDRFSHRTY